MFETCLYFNTNSLARALDRLWTEAFAPFELSPPQGFLLRIILAKPGQNVNDLASEMNIAKPTATRALNHLESAGFVKRKSSKEDGRESKIFPTAKAEQIHDDLNRASGRVTAFLKDLLGEKSFANSVTQIKTMDFKIRSEQAEK